MTRSLPVLILLSVLAVTGGAIAEPILHNAQIHPLGAPAPDLGRAFSTLLETTEGPAWAAYTAPGIGGLGTLCCGGSGVCSLERGRDGFEKSDDTADPSPVLRVMLRIEARRLSDVRAFSADCHLDAGALPVYVWDEVEERRSLDFLMARAADGRSRLAEQVLMAVAHHAGSEVDAVLERIAHGERLPRLEEEAIFWLGEARGEGGFGVLVRLRDDLEGGDLREHLTFALHLSDAPGALPALIDMARHDRDPEVRSQALFWLSQKAGERTASAIAEAAEEDPDLEVKKQAVFALSQLPPERGVPLLIHYAESHPRREVRKQAMFWLGQSEDSRALDFFEQILTR